MENKVFLSDKYCVWVEETEGRNVPVYITLALDGSGNNFPLPEDVYKEFDGLGMGTKTVKTYFASFEFKEKARVTVTLPENTKRITVKPHIDYEFTAGKMIFEVDCDRNFTLQADNDIFGSLHILCNKAKKVSNDKENIISFPKGIYTAENCEYIRIDEHGCPVMDNIKDNTLIYIDNEAIINASIVLRNVHNIKIAGSGTVSLIDRCHGAENYFRNEPMWGAFRYYAVPNIYIRSGCTDIEIEDVVLNCEFRGIVIRNSERISVKNVKMFTSTENGDGINCYNTSDLLVDGCYIQSADDCFCMYNSCDSIPNLFDDGYDNVKAVCANVEVKNCLMATGARPVVLGGHATGEVNPRCIMDNIYIHDCEILEITNRIYGNTTEHAMYWSGLLRLLSQSGQLVKNFRFENINAYVTRGHNGKAIHIEVRAAKNASYTECEGYRIENMIFKNINVTGCTEDMVPSLVRSRKAVNPDDKCGISGIVLDNVTIGGKKIKYDEIIIEGPAEVICK